MLALNARTGRYTRTLATYWVLFSKVVRRFQHVFHPANIQQPQALHQKHDYGCLRFVVPPRPRDLVSTHWLLALGKGGGVDGAAAVESQQGRIGVALVGTLTREAAVEAQKRVEPV